MPLCAAKVRARRHGPLRLKAVMMACLLEVPSYEGTPKPKVFEVLKVLPKTNCGECRQSTCMVFATLVTQGVKCANDCTPLGENEKRQLEEYMSNFSLED